MLFITHDLNLARKLCSRILVMKDGCVVEQGKTEEIFENPRQAYTRELIEAVPSMMKKRDWKGAETAGEKRPVLTVKDLAVYYQDQGKSLFSGKKKRCALSDVSFSIYEGESLGLVGESGCGKTSLSKAVLGMTKDIRGEIVHFTSHPQMIFQDPYSSLNPSKTVGWLLEEPLRAAAAWDKGISMTKEDRRAAAYDMLHKVGLDDSFYHRKPSQLSGGQRQRISIGQALIAGPGFVVADEPVSALDVTMQAQILDLMRNLKDKINSSIMLITHDLGVIAEMADYVVVMYAGRVVEKGTASEIFKNPSHPYTIGLMRSKPVVGKKVDKLYSIPGKVPNPIDMPDYCYFRDRCELSCDKCQGSYPGVIKLSPTHEVSCYRYADRPEAGWLANVHPGEGGKTHE